MAEVKTYKCDICGKVYHREENEDHFMTITHKLTDNDEKPVEYTYLCDGCIGEINRVINEPGVIDRLIENHNSVNHECGEFASMLTRIYNRMCSYIIPRFCAKYESSDYEYMITEILAKYSELRDQEYKCFEYKADCARKDKILRWTAAICGGIIGGLIAVIIHLV